MKRNVLYLICVFIFCAMSLFSALGCNRADSSEKVTAQQDGSFKILHLTDFHLYLAEEKESSILVTPLKAFDDSFTAYLDSVIESEEPDFVILGGDNIFCNSGFAEVLYDTSVRTYRAIAEYFEEKNLFWTFVFGNHDPEGGCPKRRIIKALSKYSRFIGGVEDSENFGSLILSREEDVYLDGEKLKQKYSLDDRYANYSIPVYNNSGTDIVFRIFTLDTGGFYSPPPRGVPYRELLSEQFDWLNSSLERFDQEVEAELNYMIFLHISYFDEVIAGLDAAYVGRLDGIFAGHSHSNYTTEKSVGNNSVICAITGCCQEDGADEAGTRFARVINVDTVRGAATTYCLDSDLRKQ